MNELEIIEIIKNTLSNNSFIGDDCADLQEVGMFVTQDSLIEDVHFKLSTTTPYQLGQKAVAVNISDLATMLCNPAYLTIGLSMPENISKDFVEEFYKGVNIACQQYNITVVGGDITKADKVYISITAIGRRRHSINISRKFAKEGNFVLSTGFYGTSAAGLFALENNKKVSDTILDAHLVPKARLQEAFEIGKFIEEDIAIMDTSDGLADALYKIAKASNVSINVNFEDIPILPEVKKLAKANDIDIKDWALWGGEDFELVCSVPYFGFASLNSEKFKFIGNVIPAENGNPTVTIVDGKNKIIIDEILLKNKSFKHFGG